jgi:hypothetical protein
MLASALAVAAAGRGPLAPDRVDRHRQQRHHHGEDDGEGDP